MLCRIEKGEIDKEKIKLSASNFTVESTVNKVEELLLTVLGE